MAGWVCSQVDGDKLRRVALGETGGEAGDRLDDLLMFQAAGGGEERAVGDVIFALVIHQRGRVRCIEGLFRAGERTAQRLVGPEGFVQEFLDLMLGLVEIHREFLLDHVAFLVDVRRIETWN